MLDCGSQRRGGGDVVPIRACLEPCPLEGHGLGFSEKLPDCWAEDNHQNRSDERPCQTVNQLDAVIPSHLRAPARASPLNDTRIALSTGALTLRWALQCRRDYALVAIEWYDFFIFGTAAALIFNKIFFPSFDPVTGTLAAFASFAVRFTARPVGGAVFAHYGDKLGRKPMLVYSLLLMGAANDFLQPINVHVLRQNLVLRWGEKCRSFSAAAKLVQELVGVPSDQIDAGFSIRIRL